jgi:iron-sulfur cluster repair protein YtfE (RIC family)
MERSTADKVQTQHQLLESQLSGARRAIEDGDCTEATNRVERLARSLELHLTLEEEHYFPQLRANRPELAQDFDELLVEHTELRDSLRQAVALLSHKDLPGGKAALNRYKAIFRGHEKREYDLLENPAST